MQKMDGTVMTQDLQCQYMMKNGDVERYNLFSARLLIRHASSGKMYLYNVLDIKKETSKSCQE